MIILAAMLLAFLTVPFAGGRFSALSTLRIRWVPLVMLALAMQIVVVNVVEEQVGTSVGEAVHLLSYALGLAFVWANRRVRGLTVLAVGALCNVAAIAANGGVMPTTSWALHTAGQQAESAETFSNSGRVGETRLTFLGDVFAWPAPLPLANVFSVGDVVLVVGAGAILHHGTGSRWSRRRQAPGRATASPPAGAEVSGGAESVESGAG